MCVAALAWDAHPDWLLVVAGNRDEYHARPAAPLARWQGGSGILAGTDLTGGGTWLGVTAPANGVGRFALVTNVRVPEGPQPGRPSRGKLVTDLLTGAAPENMGAMNPFNLVLVAGAKAEFLTNHPVPERRPLLAGIHGLSNGGFDVPWAKTLAVQDAITGWLAAGHADPAPLLAALRDDRPLPGTLPETGPEPRFSPVFIADPIYGTRCSTVVTVDRKGRGTIVERSFDPAGDVSGEVRLEFAWPPVA